MNNERLERLLKPREFYGIVGINYQMFKKWVREGRVHVVRLQSDRLRVPYSEVERILGGKSNMREVRAVIYARVSSSDQKADLERQIQYLTQYCSTKGYRIIDVLSDIVSGLETNRRGLLKLFNYIINRQVDAVIITYKDRLTRFKFEYFFKQYGVRIEVAYGEEPKDTYQELVEDLIAIVASFAGKLYGMRRLLEEVERNG